MVTTPPSRPTQPWNGEGEALRGMPLLCTEGGEEEPQVGLMATEDGGPTKSDAMILALPPNEALVVDATASGRGLDGGRVVEPAPGILVQTAYRVGYFQGGKQCRELCIYCEGFVWA